MLQVPGPLPVVDLVGVGAVLGRQGDFGLRDADEALREHVAEFRTEAQLIIVSHQKRTMEAADCLYGVSMKPGESSRVVSERPGADMSAYVEPTPAANADVDVAV